jgi:hypothetical protein
MSPVVETSAVRSGTHRSPLALAHRIGHRHGIQQVA